MPQRALVWVFLSAKNVVVGNPRPITELDSAGARDVPNAPNAPAAHTLRPLAIAIDDPVSGL
jgi:hypothetical protein